MTNPAADHSTTAARWTRVALAGPVAIVATLLMMLGMPLWMPGGAAGIDNIVMPILLLPLIWAALFFHACLDARLWRVALVAIGLAALNAGLLAVHFAAPKAAVTEHRR